MNDKVTAIEKTLKILLAFHPSNEPIGTSELSKKLGFHKATTSRILLTLAEYGFVYQDDDTKQFSLGEKIYELGMVLAETSINKIVRAARQNIDALRDYIDETIVLEVWSGNRTVVAYEAESDRPIKVAGRIGTPPPLHVTAGAKAILASLESSRVDTVLRGGLHAYTENTITDLDTLKMRFETYKEQGFATDRDEFDVGISAIGVPIFNHQGEAVAAVVIIMPSLRFSDDPTSKTVLALKMTAETISRKLFYRNGNPLDDSVEANLLAPSNSGKGT